MVTQSGMQVRPIIGLEIHVQLLTDTKMFCGCPVRFEAPPNSCVCPVCLGHPGTLPVINRRAFELGVRAGMALNCEIAGYTKWDRKSYYYPDMPKNYQISQYDLPICAQGSLTIESDGGERTVRIRRAHLEEDAGKNMHDPGGSTLVDLNRAGTPLLEIVTEPDLCSAEEAYVFCTGLQKLLVYLGVTEGVMKKGQMRFEPNVNVAIQSDGQEYRTPIAEIKNLNSFRAVRGAIAFEIERHVSTWRDNADYVFGKADNENRGWNDDRGVTEFQRPKEAAHDYRYFPDPDLVPVVTGESTLASIRADLPELPAARCARLQSECGMGLKEAEIITAHRPTADLFDAVIAAGGPVGAVTKQFINVWLKLANERGVGVTALDIDAQRMAELAQMVDGGQVSSSAADRLAEAMLDRSDAPDALAKEMGLLQVRDEGTTLAWVEEAFTRNESAVQDAMNNPKKAKAAAGFLRGQVMKLSGGQADPKLVGELIERRLAELSGD